MGAVYKILSTPILKCVLEAIHPRELCVVLSPFFFFFFNQAAVRVEHFNYDPELSRPVQSSETCVRACFALCDPDVKSRILPGYRTSRMLIAPTH